VSTSINLGQAAITKNERNVMTLGYVLKYLVILGKFS